MEFEQVYAELDALRAENEKLKAENTALNAFINHMREKVRDIVKTI